MVVVAAVIQKNERILIGQRKRKDRHSLKWEFPGGKVEARESPREALARELKEELNIDATIGGELTRYAYRYSSRPLFELIFFRVEHFEGEPENLAFETIAWVDPRTLPTYDFLDGDIEFVKALARGEFG
jgi:8-oxo-dGTP diphosphatase